MAIDRHTINVHLFTYLLLHIIKELKLRIAKAVIVIDTDKH